MRYFLLVDGAECEYASPESRFDAYARMERRLLDGRVRELAAYDTLEQYGRVDLFPVIILTEGEPDRG